MLIFKYSKLKESAFIPHLDTLRAIIRTLRRAEITVNYSKGFNPHMNLYMSPPIPLGIETVSEYCTVETDVKAAEFKKRYNMHCIKGMECIDAFDVLKNPNMAANITCALYIIKSEYLRDNFDEIFCKIISKKGFIVTTEKKGEIKEKDVTEDILNIEKTAEGVNCLLKFGNGGNLRIDRFILALIGQQNFDYDVIKAEVFCKSDEKVVTGEEFILKFLNC